MPGFVAARRAMRITAFSASLRHRPLGLACALGLGIGCLALPAAAAPSTDLPTATSNQPAPAQPGLAGDSVRTPDLRRDARTIDLLVEMQQPTAGIQFNERAVRRPSEVPGRAAATLPVPQAATSIDQPPTPPSGLFGSGATPSVSSRAVTADVSSRELSSTGPAPARPAGEASPELKRWLSWPRRLIEYVRENRNVIAATAAALLALGWTASVLFSRRRR